MLAGGTDAGFRQHMRGSPTAGIGRPSLTFAIKFSLLITVTGVLLYMKGGNFDYIKIKGTIRLRSSDLDFGGKEGQF